MNYNILLSCVFISILSFQSSNTAQVQPFTVLELSKFFQEIRRFSSQYSEKLANNINGNVITSPISALITSAMLSYGANGETKAELNSALNLPMNSKFVMKLFHYFISDLNNATDVELHLANALFVNNNFELKDLFRKISNMVFESEINKIDFGNKRRAAGIINIWCREKTGLRIPKIVDAGDLDNVELVMVNAVYFKGNWVNRFDGKGELEFHLSKNSSVAIQMMCNSAEYNYNLILNGAAWYIELPYESRSRLNAYSMYIILPRENHTLDDLIDQIFRINFVEMNTEKTNLYLCMPKFRIESELELTPVFKAMGISDMFGSSANFSDISDGSDVKISKIIQKAFIYVDERGSEAAAATGVMLAPQSMSEVIHVNQPFISMIVAKNTGIPLFWARVNDPRS